jgi:hypothetical protein
MTIVSICILIGILTLERPFPKPGLFYPILHAERNGLFIDAKTFYSIHAQRGAALNLSHFLNKNVQNFLFFEHF